MRVSGGLVLGVGIAAVLLFFQGPSHARTWSLERDGSGDFSVLQNAIDAAASGDSILIGPGTYTELTIYDGGLNYLSGCAKILGGVELSLIGVGADQVYLDADNGWSHDDWTGMLDSSPVGLIVVDHQSNPGSLFVSGVTFRNLAQGIYSTASLRVEGCRFENVGWAIFKTGAECSVIDCESEGDMKFWAVESGSIQGCTFNCVGGSCVDVGLGSVVEVRDCDMGGGETGISAWSNGTEVSLAGNRIRGQARQVFWISGGAVIQGSGNDFTRGYMGYQYFVRADSYSGAEPVLIDLEGNFWARDSVGGYTTAEEIGYFLAYDRVHVEIDYEPFLTESVPVSETSLGSVKAMFR